MLVILGIWRHVYSGFPLRYDPLYCGAVFPLGMYTVSTFRLAQAIEGFSVDVLLIQRNVKLRAHLPVRTFCYAEKLNKFLASAALETFRYVRHS